MDNFLSLFVQSTEMEEKCSARCSIYMGVMSNLHTHTLSVSFGDAKFLALEGKAEGRGKVWSIKFELNDRIEIT